MTTNQRMNDLLRRAAGIPPHTEQPPATGPGNIDAAAGYNHQPMHLRTPNAAMNEAIREGVFRILEERS